jgi:hypothetical protein
MGWTEDEEEKSRIYEGGNLVNASSHWSVGVLLYSGHLEGGSIYDSSWKVC